MVKGAARSGGDTGQGGAPRTISTRRTHVPVAPEAPRTSGSESGNDHSEAVSGDVAAASTAADAAVAAQSSAADSVSNLALQPSEVAATATVAHMTERQPQPLSPQTPAGSPKSWASVVHSVRETTQDSASQSGAAAQPAALSRGDADTWSSADTVGATATASQAAAEAVPTSVGEEVVSTPRSSSWHEGPRMGSLRSGPRQRLQQRSTAADEGSDESDMQKLMLNVINQQEQSVKMAQEDAAERRSMKASMADQEVRLDSLAEVVQELRTNQLSMMKTLQTLTVTLQSHSAERVITAKQAESALREADMTFKKATAQLKAAADRTWQLEDSVRDLMESRDAVAKQAATAVTRADSVQNTVNKLQGTVKGVQQRVDDLQGSIEANLAHLQGATDEHLNDVGIRITQTETSVEKVWQQVRPLLYSYTAAQSAADPQRYAQQAAKQAPSVVSERAGVYGDIPISTPGSHRQSSASHARSGDSAIVKDLMRRSKGVADKHTEPQADA